jgi:hypothetical protein
VKRIQRLILIFTILVVASCNKRDQPLTWNADWTAPLAYGELTIADLLPDSLLVSNPDSSIQLVFNADLYKLDFNELVALPDTNLLDTFSLPLITPVSFSPGQVFINQPEENVLDAAGAELTSLKIKSGQLSYKLGSTVQGDVIYTYQIPSATDVNGVTFSKSVNVPAASNGERSKVSGAFSLDGYTLDLTGSTGNSFNTILTSIDCKVSPSFTTNVSVSNQDTIFISNKLESISIARADGYFGQQSLETGWENVAFDGFDMFSSGNIGVDELEMQLTIENGVGADALIEVIGLSSNNEAGDEIILNHSLVGTTQQLNRAYENAGGFVPSQLVYNLDENNSNITSMISSLPSSLGYNFNVTINPLGNISGYNDFLDINSPLKLSLDANMPLSVLANDLTLVDTLDLQISDTSMLNSMTLMIDMLNGFPLSAEVSMAVLDQNDKIVSYLFSPSEIYSAEVDLSGIIATKSESYHELMISEKDMERIKTYGKVVLTVAFNSEGSTPVKLYDYYTLDYNIKADANVTISIR